MRFFAAEIIIQYEINVHSSNGFRLDVARFPNSFQLVFGYVIVIGMIWPSGTSALALQLCQWALQQT
jgi:hypothetical protein